MAYTNSMAHTRLPSAALMLIPALMLGLSGCEISGDGSETVGFDSQAERNKPEPPRFGRKAEPISPEALKILKSAGEGGRAMGSGADSSSWGKLFDGSRTRSPLVEPAGPGEPSRVKSMMSAQGVRSDIIDTVMSESKRQNADPLLVFSVIKQESDFDPKARSQVGARGLMQVMPETGKDLGVKNPSQLYDVGVNVAAGVSYLSQMFGMFSDVAMSQISTINPFSDSGVKSAIAAYNAGPGAVSRYGGVPPFRETRDYVVKVLGNYKRYREQLALTKAASSSQA